MSENEAKTIQSVQMVVALLDLETLAHAKAHDIRKAKLSAELAERIHCALVDYAVCMNGVFN